MQFREGNISKEGMETVESLICIYHGKKKAMTEKGKDKTQS